MMPSLTLDIITTLKKSYLFMVYRGFGYEYGESRVVPTTNRYHTLTALDVL